MKEIFLNKEDIRWSGNIQEITATISKFKDDWLSQLDALSDEELQSTQYTKWAFEELSFFQLAGWLNLELMKNASEIGSVRFMFGSK